MSLRHIMQFQEMRKCKDILVVTTKSLQLHQTQTHIIQGGQGYDDTFEDALHLLGYFLP